MAVVRRCVTTTLAAETFSLLNVYLSYKFGLGLPSFYLLFSLFKNDLEILRAENPEFLLEEDALDDVLEVGAYLMRTRADIGGL